MISGHQEFFFLAIWWAGYFFSFFSHKLSITFVLHAIFFFRQALAGIFFSKSTPPPPRLPQELNGRPLSKTTTEIRPCITHFLYISFPFLHAYHVLMPNFAFFCTASTSNYEILFPLLIFDMVNWNSTSGEFAFI